jgi:elongator complex protein 2
MSSVNQVKFDGNGLVYSVSEDMTCRVFGPDHNGKWNELARPQIHGHPIKTLEFASENRLISGSDEKVIRVFESPRMVLESFENICGFHIDIKTVSSPATVPALGLSNKISESHKDLKTFVKPPFEAELIETLYPEIEKLYGHESSIFTLCRIGNYLFSSCVGKGKVIVWSLESYDAIQELRDHTHTVSSIACSGEKLVTVSRDRSMCIYKKGENGLFCLEKLIPKAHARIIWGVSFSNDGNIIFTGSRDKMMKIWSATGTLLGSLEFEDSITSISVLPQLFHHGHVIGIGLECGKVHIYYYDVTIKQILSDKSLDHFGRVNSIDWFLNGTNYLLVTGGEDCAVKISQIYL